MKKGKVSSKVLGFVFICLIIGMMMGQSYVVSATGFSFSAGALVYLDPSDNTYSASQVTVGKRFNVTVWVANVVETLGVQVYLEFNDSLLNVTRWFQPGNDPQYIFYGKTTSALATPPDPSYNHTGPSRGKVLVAVSLFPCPPTQPLFTGSGKVCVFEFKITAVPTTGEYSSSLLIDTVDTFLLDKNGDEISNVTKENGYYKISAHAHDVAVTNVEPSSNFAIRGSIVNVNVSVTNEGSSAETFNLTTYANTTSLGTHTIHLPNGSSTSTIFSWDTSSYLGSYEIWAQASTVANETDIEDNVKHDGIVQVRVGIHDIAITSVEVSKDTAVPGELLWVSVGVANWGDFPEFFWVSTYADAETTTIGDETVIGTMTIYLAQLSSTTLYFLWNTTEAAPGSVTISAKAQILPEETNKTNNILVDDVVDFIPDVHDIAVVDIRSSENAAYVGDPIRFEVEIQNQGNTMETVTVTAFADLNTTILGDEITVGTSTMSIGSYGTERGAINWDTWGLSGGNYTISAVATPLPEEVDVADNNKTDGKVQLFSVVPCPDINITCPMNVTFNPSIYSFNWTLRALQISLGNVTINSTGFEGLLRVVGSTNGTVHLHVDQPGKEYAYYDVPRNGSVRAPLWVIFDPGYYQGTYQLALTICGTHRIKITINIISISICSNGVHAVNGGTATFNWVLTGGSLVYLVAETDLPPGWTYTVDPPIGAFFETPHLVTVNITAPLDAKEGETGRVTLRAFKNSTGMMIWQFIYFASTDNNPPAIESVEMPVATPDGYLMFNTTVRDLSGIAEVLLHYSVDGGPWQSSTMQWASGDTFNATKYTAKEFFGTNMPTVQYYVSATDWFGNQTLSETRTVTIMNDIEVGCVNANETYVLPATNFTLSVKVMNRGTLPLSFVNLAIYANSTLLSTQPICNLLNGTETTLNLTFQLPYGRYILTAYTTSLPYEAVITNNANDTMVTVALTGDINIDRKVDLKDVYAVGKAYGATPGHTRWNVVCDINGDGKIDLKDYFTTCKNYGKEW